MTSGLIAQRFLAQAACFATGTDEGADMFASFRLQDDAIRVEDSRDPTEVGTQSRPYPPFARYRRILDCGSAAFSALLSPNAREVTQHNAQQLNRWNPSAGASITATMSLSSKNRARRFNPVYPPKELRALIAVHTYQAGT